MSFQLKTVIISFALALAGAFLVNLQGYNAKISDYAVAFGMIGFFGGILEVVIGLFLLLLEDKKYAHGFLISGGLLMVIGFGTCTAGLSGMSFH